VVPERAPQRPFAPLVTQRRLGNEEGRRGCWWLDKLGVDRLDTGENIEAAEAERIIRLGAAHVRREGREAAPIVSAELPEGGERFEGLIPPIVTAPCFAIRKPTDLLYRLSDYVSAGILSPRQPGALECAVRARKNILVAGGTSSGKTTLANALLAEVAAQDERVVILEDMRELKCAARDGGLFGSAWPTRHYPFFRQLRWRTPRRRSSQLRSAAHLPVSVRHAAPKMRDRTPPSDPAVRVLPLCASLGAFAILGYACQANRDAMALALISALLFGAATPTAKAPAWRC